MLLLELVYISAVVSDDERVMSDGIEAWAKHNYNPWRIHNSLDISGWSINQALLQSLMN
jgi:hypothetical protein